MLDRDLAMLYGVPTGRMNEQVKRNIARFPESFRFQLTECERDEVIAFCDNLKNIKYNPSLPAVSTPAASRSSCSSATTRTSRWRSARTSTRTTTPAATSTRRPPARRSTKSSPTTTTATARASCFTTPLGTKASSVLSRRLVEEGNARIVGEKHIKMRVCYRNKYCRPIDAIAFNQKENFDKVTSGEDFDMLYHVEENTWNNVTSIQLNVKDIKCSD